MVPARMIYLAPLVVLLFAPNARAEERIYHPVQLEYIRGEGTQDCPGTWMLRHAITSPLKADPFVPAAKAKVRVVIRRVGSAFQPTYEFLNEEGEYLRGQPLPSRPDCTNAVKDVAFYVRLDMPVLISDSTPLPAPVPVPATATTTSTPAPGEPLRSPQRSSPAEPALSVKDWVDVGVVMSLWAAPIAAFGFRTHLGRRWSWFSFAGGAQFEFSLPDGTDNFHVSTSRVLGEVVPCVNWNLGRSLAFGCGLVQAGVLIDRVQRSTQVTKHNLPSVSAGVRGGVQIRLPRRLPLGLEPYIAVDLTGAVWRAHIVAMGDGLYEWRGSPIIGALALGVSL